MISEKIAIKVLLRCYGAALMLLVAVVVGSVPTPTVALMAMGSGLEGRSFALSSAMDDLGRASSCSPHDQCDSRGQRSRSVRGDGSLEGTIKKRIAKLKHYSNGRFSARQCLAEALYFEARGETPAGRSAVAAVILNRVHHYRFPDTICAVVYQNAHRRHGCQFSFACDGLPETVHEHRTWKDIYQLAGHILKNNTKNGTHLHGATHFHANYVSPSWKKTMVQVGVIGTHIFYRFPQRRASIRDARRVSSH